MLDCYSYWYFKNSDSHLACYTVASAPSTIFGESTSSSELIAEAVPLLALPILTWGWPCSILKAHPFYERRAKVGSTSFSDSTCVSGYFSMTVLLQRLQNA